MGKLVKNVCDQFVKEQILAELETCDFETYVNALNLTFGQSMAANDVFFVGKLDDEAFYQSILEYMIGSRFGVMNLMDIVRGLATGESHVSKDHKYVTYTPSLDGMALRSYKDLDDLKKSLGLECLAEHLLEDKKYRRVLVDYDKN